MRPTAYLFGDDPASAWTARDRGLAEGLIAQEDAIGPHGIPWAVALDDDSDGWFEVVEHHDYAQAVLDQWQQENGGKDAEPGIRLTVRDTRVKPGGSVT